MPIAQDTNRVIVVVKSGCVVDVLMDSSLKNVKVFIHDRDVGEYTEFRVTEAPDIKYDLMKVR